ncbi:MAG: hypothetical protein IJ873_04010 [Lachnospiraceae bacterium]|nr:hypothetical protein [Lachnospiraceae bacterium]
MEKQGKAYFTVIRNFAGIKRRLVFHFDTGASVSLIGLNSICGDDLERRDILARLIREEIAGAEIVPYEPQPQTVTKDTLEVYPCRCSDVSIHGTPPIDFYFHIYLGTVNMPLLGFDYIDDCCFSHSISGDIHITAIAENAGKRFYPDKVIDFNKVMDKFRVLLL